MIPISRGADGYLENTTNKRIWKIRTTLKCKRKKKPNGEPDKHKARAAARGDTLRRSMIKAQAPLPISYSPTIMPLTFALFTGNQTCPDRGTKRCPVRLVRGGNFLCPSRGTFLRPRGTILRPRGTFLCPGRGTF